MARLDRDAEEQSMKKPLLSLLILGVGLVLLQSPAVAETAQRWSEAKAKDWYAQQKWPLGSNYLPANAINQLEMWQAETFDPERIDLELGWAQAMGMNTMRVFLHSLLWQQDAKGFKQRIDKFLEVASRHGIKPIIVLFDSCWDPEPRLGPQHAPVPGVHNSGWVQDPGVAMADPDQYPRFEKYVKGVVGAYASDKRILAWDVWNEPDNTNGMYEGREPANKVATVAKLLPQVFAWARSVAPIQPLTSGVWHDDNWSNSTKLNLVEQVQLGQSDILSFHSYDWPEGFAARVHQLSKYDRPLICTEYMARGAGSTIDGVLPLGKKLDVGMINWGFVEGRSQTIYPWDSWDRPYTKQPTVWFHDLLHRDGEPYRKREINIIQALAQAPRGVVPQEIYAPPSGQDTEDSNQKTPTQ
jgi:hypothetical protein